MKEGTLSALVVSGLLLGLLAVGWVVTDHEPVAVLGVPLAAPAPPVLTLTGHPRVVDGDTLAYGDLRVRFGGGVDAFEKDQRCVVAGVEQRCGRLASAHLERLIAGQVVTCTGDGETDKRGRPIARCSVPGVEDLGAALVATGWAVVDERFGEGYLPLQGGAYFSGAGAWARPWAFEMPRAWRAHGKRAEAGR